MKTIGILGGLGPESTVDYYKELIKGFNDLNGAGILNYPEIIIYSVNIATFISLLEERNYYEATNHLAQSINNIRNAGADFAVISSNTPHLLFNDIQSKVDLPLISIVDVCAQKAQAMNIKRCGLLGTKFTMQNDFYHKVFERYDIEIFVPDNSQIDVIHTKLFNELELGILKEDTKNEILDIVLDLKAKHNIESIILGCTEFPLMFREETYCEIPFLNTTKIHVEAIIKACLSDN